MAVRHGDPGLEFRDMTVEVRCFVALAEQFHAMHLFLDAASTMASDPSSPEGAAFVHVGIGCPVPGLIGWWFRSAQAKQLHLESRVEPLN